MSEQLPRPVAAITFPGELLAVRIIDLIILLVESTPMEVREQQARDNYRRWDKLLTIGENLCDSVSEKVLLLDAEPKVKAEKSK